MKKYLLLACLSLALSACGLGRHVQKGINAYNAGDLGSAMSIWQSLERDEAGMNQKGLVRYLVYRGLTHHRMGHPQWALRFLSRGKAAYLAGNPNWLPASTAVQMNQALAQLGGGAATMPGAGQGGAPEPVPEAVPEGAPGGVPEPVDIQ